ncbi:MAG: methyltransferase domain-containing protein [Nitrososphaera sp.]
MPQLVSVNPLKLALWTFRRSPRDIIDLYNTLSPVMQLATGGKMLNLGFWSDGIADPIAAQSRLCSIVGDDADLSSAATLIDVGSGLGAPARQWKSTHELLEISCVNINQEQLRSARGGNANSAEHQKGVSPVNATSVALPFSDHSADRIVALESAQHFRPLAGFVNECRRVLKPNGLLVVAMPVTVGRLGGVEALFKLGILWFTWSSEHYSLEHVKTAIAEGGFDVRNIALIGHHVYEPLTEYYFRNRMVIRQRITKEYPSFVENVLYKSLTKMAETSRKGIIDYAVIKAQRL